MQKLNQKLLASALCAVIMCAFGCGKPATNYQSRYIGRILNTKDSLPYVSRPFKLYKSSSTISKEQEFKFATDGQGRFNVTTELQGGLLCWPDYFPGSAYLGASPVYAIGSSKDETTGIYTLDFGTVYFEPYP
jgi:hypothetical protein